MSVMMQQMKEVVSGKGNVSGEAKIKIPKTNNYQIPSKSNYQITKA
jgi:hypothetical protein